MKYPFIARNKYDVEILVLSESKSIILSNPHKGALHDVYPTFSRNYKNITHEYLQNTYGVVESKEHAEFIVDLAELHGFEVDENSDNPKSFMIYDDVISIYSFSHKELSNQKCRKQITIPLPPKETLKNAGDNLILGCEDSKCDEWPKVGDEVIAIHPADQLEGKLLALTKEYAIISQGDGEQHLHLKSWGIKKPKTPEEKLRDWMHERIGYGIASGFDCEQITHDLLHHLNITKKPQ